MGHRKNDLPHFVCLFGEGARARSVVAEASGMQLLEWHKRYLGERLLRRQGTWQDRITLHFWVQPRGTSKPGTPTSHRDAVALFVCLLLRCVAVRVVRARTSRSLIYMEKSKVALGLLVAAAVAVPALGYCNGMKGQGYGPRTSTAFPPGWNGLARTPFRGWYVLSLSPPPPLCRV